MRRRVVRNSVILAGLTVVGACGVRRPGPSTIVFETTVQVVSALDAQVGLPQVVPTVANGVEQRSDASGTSVIQAQNAGTVSLRLLHPAFIERETSVRVPDDRP